MPARFAAILCGFILFALVSLIVSGIATGRHSSIVDGVWGLWISAWLPLLRIAFPVVLVVASIALRLVAVLVKAPTATSA